MGCLAMYFSCCLASDALNIIQPAFTEKMGWTYSAVSVPFTIANYMLIVLSFGFSTYILKNGTRKFAARILGFTFVIACLLFYFASADTMILIWIAAVMMASIVGGTPNLHPSSIIYVFGPQEHQAANRVLSIIISVFSSFGVQLMSTKRNKIYPA